MSLCDITGDDPAARMAAFGQLLRAELFVLLSEEGDDAPRRFDIGDTIMVLAFEELEELGQFTGGPAPYAAVPGRVLVAELAVHGLSLGLNFGAESAVQLSPATLSWLHEVTVALPPPIPLPEMRFHPDPILAEALQQAVDGLFPQEVTLWLTADAAGPIVIPEGGIAAIGRAVQEAALFAGIEPVLRVSLESITDADSDECLQLISRPKAQTEAARCKSELPPILRKLR